MGSMSDFSDNVPLFLSKYYSYIYTKKKKQKLTCINHVFLAYSQVRHLDLWSLVWLLIVSARQTTKVNHMEALPKPFWQQTNNNSMSLLTFFVFYFYNLLTVLFCMMYEKKVNC